ncbi:MAG: hypothetical protein ACYDEY_05340 [Acidimicrobiales bacterium]
MVLRSLVGFLNYGTMYSYFMTSLYALSVVHPLYHDFTKVNLSLGRGRPDVVLVLPNVEDPVTAELVSPELWSEIQLCWDQNNRQSILHFLHKTARQVSSTENMMAIDEGVINPMPPATCVDELATDRKCHQRMRRTRCHEVAEQGGRPYSVQGQPLQERLS